jgi:hypothetical protein
MSANIAVFTLILASQTFQGQTPLGQNVENVETSAWYPKASPDMIGSLFPRISSVKIHSQTGSGRAND